jgi:hypothetical protein
MREIKPKYAHLLHLEVANGLMSLVGEHKIAGGGPFNLTENFFGCSLALTDYDSKRNNFLSTLMFQGDTLEELYFKRKECLERLQRLFYLERDSSFHPDLELSNYYMPNDCLLLDTKR